jgi:site-specific recombinase XerD
MKTIKEAIKEYLEETELNKAKSTAKAYGYQFNTIINYLNSCNVKYLEQLEVNHIKEMINHMKNKCKNITINKRVRLIKEILRFSEVDKPNIMSLKKLKQTTIHFNPFTEMELKKIMNYINSMDSSNPYELTRMVIVLLLIETGVRQSELLNIKISNIDLDNNTIKLTSTKTKEEGYVFFTYMTNNLLQEYIKFYPEREYLLFNYISYKRFNYRNLTAFMQHLREKLNLKRCHAHMFRHTMATMLIENGCPLDSVQKILRHKNISTTQIYLHMSIKKAKRDYEQYSVLTNLKTNK